MDYQPDEAGLTNIYIESVLQKCTLQRYEGYYSCDNIPLKRLSKLNFFNIICNLDKSDGPGTHFVSIIANKTRILYIDPLGNDCTNKFVRKFLNIIAKTTNRKISINTFSIQHSHSYFCGFYAILFMLKYDRSNPVKIKFTINKWTNDEICIKYIKYFIRKYMK